MRRPPPIATPRAGGPLRRQAGQASVIVVGGLVAILLGALVLALVGRGGTREARAQRAADLAALAGARAMHDAYGRLFEPVHADRLRPGADHLDKRAYLALGRAAAQRVAEANGVPGARVAFPDGRSFAPVRIAVTVRDRFELRTGGARRSASIEARAEAELAPPSELPASGGGYDGPLAERQGERMRPDVARAFDRMERAARADGVALVVTSGYRSDAEQAVLYAANPDPRWVAPPGRSLHRLGTELDLGPPAAHDWLASHAGRFHFVQRYAWEPWHQAREQRYFAMRTWAGIVRVSFMGARKAGAADFHADRDQVSLIEAAVPKGDQLELLPAELNVSGGLPLEQRPSLLAAVEGVEQGRYAGVIVGYLSRLGRNVREQLRTYDRVHAAGGRIIVAQEGIDARTRTGRLQRNILAAIHEDEREMHVERFDNLRRWATEAGIWQRRQTPRGYRRDPATRRLVPDEQAEEVRWAFAARATGAVPILAIAERLRMSSSGARYLLGNRVYLGELTVGAYTNPAAHPPLVDPRTFEAAQRDVARPARRRRAPALLAGLARCASCGHAVTRGASQVPIYSCPTYHSGMRCPGPAAVTLKLLDAHVERIALAELSRLSVRAGPNTGLAQAEADVGAAQAELDAYLEAVSAIDVGVGEFAAGARRRRAELDRARDGLRAQMAIEPAMSGPRGGAEVWATLDGYERNALLRGLLRAVIVARAGGRGSRTPLEDRVRVLSYGSELELPERGGGQELPLGVRPIALPNLDDPGVLRVPVGEDGLEDGGGAGEMWLG